MAGNFNRKGSGGILPPALYLSPLLHADYVHRRGKNATSTASAEPYLSRRVIDRFMTSCERTIVSQLVSQFFFRRPGNFSNRAKLVAARGSSPGLSRRSHSAPIIEMAG